MATRSQPTSAASPASVDGGSGTATVDIGAFEALANPTTFTVTTALDENDGGLGLGSGDSLREVMQVANDNVGADTIVFDSAAYGNHHARRGRRTADDNRDPDHHRSGSEPVDGRECTWNQDYS